MESSRACPPSPPTTPYTPPSAPSPLLLRTFPAPALGWNPSLTTIIPPFPAASTPSLIINPNTTNAPTLHLIENQPRFAFVFVILERKCERERGETVTDGILESGSTKKGRKKV